MDVVRAIDEGRIGDSTGDLKTGALEFINFVVK